MLKAELEDFNGVCATVVANYFDKSLEKKVYLQKMNEIFIKKIGTCFISTLQPIAALDWNSEASTIFDAFLHIFHLFPANKKK